MASPPPEFDFEFLDWCIISNQAAGDSGMGEEILDWCIVSHQGSGIGEEKEPDQFHILRLVEAKRRSPRTDYMENLQKYINPRSRAHCVGWLMDAVEGLGYTPQTLHLAINCLDRYLSVNIVDCDEFEFVGLTCLMIASKYEEVRPAGFDFDAYLRLTADTCSRHDFIRMERIVLISLGYGLAIPTTWTFLEMLLFQVDAVGSKQISLRCIAGYIANASLVSYSMIRFAPSMVAASSVFLARYVLDPCTSPWNPELQTYTKYGATDLRDCVLALLSTCHMPTKYSQLLPPSITTSQVFYSESCC